MKRSKKRVPHKDKKLVKYLEENDKPRFRSYAQKHGVDIPHVRLDGDNTLLHLSAKLGNDDFTRYFLKKGVDPLYVNAAGDLALHLAAGYALSGTNKYAYTDLVLPLVDKCPDSLDIPNARGFTCRQLLSEYKTSRSTEIDSSTTESSSASEAETDTSSWKRRLEEELHDEYMEDLGAYEEDFTAEAHPETWDQWADRINHEHHHKTRTYRHPPQSTKRKPQSQGGGEGTQEEGKPPRVSDERKRAFNEHMAKQAARSAEEAELRKNVAYKTRIQVYEKLCRSLFEDVNSDQTQLGISDGSLDQKEPGISDRSEMKLLCYDDIPWPVAKQRSGRYPREVTGEQVATFLFEGFLKSSEEYKRYLKTQQRRWHPDRFLQKSGARLSDLDKERIVNMVTKISQVLNKLSEEEKPS